VRFYNLTTGPVVDAGLQILDERTVHPYVQALCAVTDCEDGLVKVEGLLQEQFVHCCAGDIGFSALWNGIFTVSLWVNVKPASG
jgi:hypothetical protein